jgi:general secretion pathway protein G
MQCPRCNVALPTDARFCAACGQAIPGARGPAAISAPIWIIIVAALAGVVPVIGIIAAIAIPNFLNAMDRGKQKRTMADMRSIWSAAAAYADKNRSYPAAADLEVLRSQLEPKFIRKMPTVDGWGHALQLSADGASFALVSLGKDGIPDGCDGGETSQFIADICLRDGEFTQWPAGGIQH